MLNEVDAAGSNTSEILDTVKKGTSDAFNEAMKEGMKDAGLKLKNGT